MLLRQGKLDDALAAAEHLLNGGSPRSEGAILKAHVLAARGDFALARSELERASAESNGDLEPLRTLCRLLFEHGEPADAKQTIEELIRRDPQDAAALHNLGMLHQLRRDHAAARKRCIRGTGLERPRCQSA